MAIPAFHHNKIEIPLGSLNIGLYRLMRDLDRAARQEKPRYPNLAKFGLVDKQGKVQEMLLHSVLSEFRGVVLDRRTLFVKNVAEGEMSKDTPLLDVSLDDVMLGLNSTERQLLEQSREAILNWFDSVVVDGVKQGINELSQTLDGRAIFDRHADVLEGLADGSLNLGQVITTHLDAIKRDADMRDLYEGLNQKHSPEPSDEMKQLGCFVSSEIQYAELVGILFRIIGIAADVAMRSNGTSIVNMRTYQARLFTGSSLAKTYLRPPIITPAGHPSFN